MLGVSFASGRTARYLTLALAAVSITLLLTDHADARRRHHRHHRAHVERSGYNPPFASIVVDANSGATLQSTNADALRHPASLTKIMTLYMLFEQLDSGKLRLDSQLEVSRHASVQAPTKLGLRPGQTIRVEDAIKGIVTRSANDAAVVVAEAIGGSEENFCKMMTRKARALGMSKTTYVNASGLPDDDQITTARDQATLGRAIQDRFPTYYRYFSTSVFTWRGSPIRNHNHLLGQMDGVDGIKTGYVRASGFNLVTNIRRGNRHLVGVVLGGRSGGSRDATMRRLLAEHLDEGATRRTVAAITERNPC
ncbi:MAG: D-alanyl-D-alanine carboxypeptidase, partial [Afipia sp.]|nr:D-alanyl-D-alanine carboxypeptidase [Afipia sp.]